MNEPHQVLNALSEGDARQALARCCGSLRWVNAMLLRRPFASWVELGRAADEVWKSLAPEDFLEAFAHHPRIGADVARLRERFATTASLAVGEQSGVAEADARTLEALRDENIAYEARFGFIFIVCATGKTAEQMLSLLRARMHNEPQVELSIAAREQAKITLLRLEKLAS